MTKLDIKNVASVLASNHNMSETDAEKFLNVLFDVIRDGLLEDSMVKVKGLGTFKLMDVSEREMVDVNTGERIIAEARQRVSFTPDSVLRDIVNKPFVFFDTVMLKDGVVFDDENEEPENDDEIISDGDTDTNDAEEARNDKPELTDTVTDNDINTDTDVTTEYNKEETAVSESDASEQEVINNEEPVTSGDDEVHSEDVVTEDIITEEHDEDKTTEITEDNVLSREDDKVDEEPSEDDKEEEVSEENIKSETVTDEDETSDNHKENTSRKKIWITFIIAVVFISAVAFMMGIYAGGGKLAILPNEEEETNVVTDTVIKEIIVKDTATVTEEKDSVVTDSIKVEEKKEVTKPEFDSDYYDGLDQRVRTGAYRIVGVDTIVTVKKGQTIQSITKIFLGAGMECYVETLNGITEVKEGDKLKIPKVEWRKKRKE